MSAPWRPRVSLLLPTRDSEHTLDLVLGRLAATTDYADLEVVAVDDGSTDGTRAILHRWREGGRLGRFRVLEQAPSGAIDALNRALREATGEVCVQIDSDASLETEGWLPAMLALLGSDPRVGAVTARVVMDSGRLHACGVNVVQPAGLHDRPARIVEPVGRRRRHDRVERPREGRGEAVERDVAEVDAGMGCCLMYRRADALEAGGYDAGYAPVWFDDLDLCLGLRAMGRKVFCLPQVRVLHHLSLRRGSPRRAEALRRAAQELQQRAARRLPHDLRNGLEARLGIDVDRALSRAQLARLSHHYAYWESKWGWDPLNPDMAEIERRWGATELWWAHDPARRSAGEAIIAAYRAATTELAPSPLAG